MENQQIKPFPLFCLQIGVIPSIFDESLSYWDMMCSLVNFLNDTVIKNVNKNTDTINSLIEFTNNLNTTLVSTIARVSKNENDINLLYNKYNIEIPILRDRVTNIEDKEQNDFDTLTQNINNLKTYTDSRFDEFFSSPQFENALNEAFDNFFTDDKIREYLNDDLLNGILAEVRDRPKSYLNLDSVKADVDNLVFNQIVITLNYYFNGDNGGAMYVVFDNSSRIYEDDGGYFIKLNDTKMLRMLLTKDYVTDAQYGISVIHSDEDVSKRFKNMLENINFTNVILTQEMIPVLDSITLNRSKHIVSKLNSSGLNIKITTPFTMNVSSYQQDYTFENIKFYFDEIPQTDDLILFNCNYFQKLELLNCSFFGGDTPNAYLTYFNINNGQTAYTTLFNIVCKNCNINLAITNDNKFSPTYLFKINEQTKISNFVIDNLNVNSDNADFNVVDFPNGKLKLYNSNFNIKNISNTQYLFNCCVIDSKNNYFSPTAKNVNNDVLTIFSSCLSSINDSLYDNRQVEQSLDFQQLYFINSSNQAVYDVHIENLYAICTRLLNITGRSGSKSFTCYINNSFIYQKDSSYFNNISNCDNFIISNTTFEIGENTLYPIVTNFGAMTVVKMINVNFSSVLNVDNFSPILDGNSMASLVISSSLINDEPIKGIPQDDTFSLACAIGTIFPANDDTHLGVRKYTNTYAIAGTTQNNWLTV